LNDWDYLRVSEWKYATQIPHRLHMVSPDLVLFWLFTYLPLVVQFAKKTGDYTVLSHADICVLALTHSLHVREKALSESATEQASFII